MSFGGGIGSRLTQPFRVLWSRYRNPIRASVWTVQGIAAFHMFFAHLYAFDSAAGPSMLPLFDLVGDSILIKKEHRRGRGVGVGDVVVFKIPTERESFGVKRVVGMPGDYVLINSPESGSDKMLQVPQGHCWVVGDNLPVSRDSRHWGPLPLALIQGKIIAKHQHWSDFQWIENPLSGPR
ncbi:hypothetical protein GGTG_07915 [Gaeumannomyces tritici R3-111a-1]|uniref:Peptidase S26 domain-containing protein n=1 Tax=Gaeumannomyces tritici (strain R3-111a-1) TaxID=644352 RepID=J3P324_GAET3|nr:hypothetical protein GGTG_07915 [Gaeumannomyces tritici R3-111a-1]EJT74066.1 hypothetical protein GGTG_07915 [Gaeumannomyces tritici R3-111a-1]